MWTKQHVNNNNKAMKYKRKKRRETRDKIFEKGKLFTQPINHLLGAIRETKRASWTAGSHAQEWLLFQSFLNFSLYKYVT
jgi:hypothetical protein